MPGKPRLASVKSRLALVALVTLVIGGGCALWQTVLKDYFIPENWGVVERGMVYRSGLINGGLVEDTLRRHNIRVIVNLIGDDPANRDQAAEARAVRELGIEMFRFPMRGNGLPADGKIDSHAAALIAVCKARREGKPVLIHCAAGAYRAGGVVAAYQLLVQRKTSAKVMAELRRHGWEDGDGRAKLVQFLNDNMTELARRLVEAGAIDSAPDPIPVLTP